MVSGLIAGIFLFAVIPQLNQASAKPLSPVSKKSMLTGVESYSFSFPMNIGTIGLNRPIVCLESSDELVKILLS